MQRLFVAILILVGLIGLLAVALSALRTAMGPRDDSGGRTDDMPQKVAFFLLLALIGYVSTTGAP